LIIHQLTLISEYRSIVIVDFDHYDNVIPSCRFRVCPLAHSLPSGGDRFSKIGVKEGCSQFAMPSAVGRKVVTDAVNERSTGSFTAKMSLA